MPVPDIWLTSGSLERGTAQEESHIREFPNGITFKVNPLGRFTRVQSRQTANVDSGLVERV
jgi:hypothetical protein